MSSSKTNNKIKRIPIDERVSKTGWVRYKNIKTRIKKEIVVYAIETTLNGYIEYGFYKSTKETITQVTRYIDSRYNDEPSWLLVFESERGV